MTTPGHGAHALANVNINAHNNIIIGGGVDLLALAIDHGGQAADATANLTMHASEDITVNGSRFKLRSPGSLGSDFASIEINDGVFLGAIALGTGPSDIHAHGNAQGSINAVNNVTINHGVFELAAAVTTSGSSARANANLEIQAGLTTKIGAGQLSIFLSSKATSSMDSGSAEQHPFDAPRRRIVGQPHGLIRRVRRGAGLALAAAALRITPTRWPRSTSIRTSCRSTGRWMSSPLPSTTAAAAPPPTRTCFIHANHVAIGTESGHDSIVVAAVAIESGTQGASVNAHANARILANNASSSAIAINDITVFWRLRKIPRRRRRPA